MQRRRFLFASLLLIPTLAVAAAGVPLRGKLTEAGIRLTDGKVVTLKGDEDTMGVLRDPRLLGSDFEVVGNASASGQFEVDPIQTHALFVYRDSKRLRVTYWCDICAIRTYTPGLCWCCREDSVLDPREDA